MGVPSRWTILAYDRWPSLSNDAGLLLDEVTHADLTGDLRRLDACLTTVFTHYKQVMARTLHQTINGETIGKLYADRAVPGGRLDRYYRANAPWPIVVAGRWLRPAELAKLRLVVNGNAHTVDFAELMIWLRVRDRKSVV